MTITDGVLAAGWALLEERYGKEFSTPMKRLYRRLLERQGFTDEELERAVEGVILRGRFFPTPQELIDVVRGTREERAAVDWQRALDEDWAALSVDGREALRAVGDPELQMAPMTDIVWLRREFVKAYGTIPVPDARPAITTDAIGLLR